MELIEERVNALERVVFGNEEREERVENTRVIDQLVNINNKLSAKINNSDKIKEVMGKLGSIHKYTDPSNAPNLTLSNEEKMQVINAAENRVNRNAALLQEIDRMRCALDSEHIRKAPSLFPKLSQLGAIQAGQLQLANETTGEVSDLVENYNQLITSLAQQMSFWDRKLAMVEAKTAQS